ncbi:retinoblastoma-binding protein 5 homolog [Dysidea avara]|uniref:retinoblastoma-binding protein 5 homolog n=1 Tax=Dysidea avara TaxID=196820 RepID=UPI00332F3CA1
MNLALLQSFSQNYPEHNDGYLDSGSEALTCAFNRRGNYLAVGCNDGRIAVWDFMTRGIAISYSSHTHPITSLSWSRSSRRLLSSSTDWNVCLWDVLSGDCEYKFRFPSPVLKTQFNPRDSSMFLVCPMKHSPVIVYLNKDGNPGHTHQSLFTTDQEMDGNVVASFDRRGQYIISGNSKGNMVVVDAKTLEVKKVFKLSANLGAVAVKSVEFARKGSHCLVNSTDRIVRVYDVDDIVHNADSGTEPEALQRLQDLVNKTMWKKCCFSGDGQYIVAGTARHHTLYIWDKASGNLVKILSGQKGEMLLDVVWHPVLPIICSVSNGVVNIWGHMLVENWSAFAPDFQELEENIDYDEKEDEFDIEDEDRSVEGEKGASGKEDNFVDVITPADIPAYYSSGDEDDDEEPLDWLPIAPEIEDPDEAGWGQLEPNLNELPTDSISTDNKENVSRKRSLSDSTTTATASIAENGPLEKKVKVVDIFLDKNSSAAVPDVRKEPFVDVQSIDDDDDPNTSVVSTTKEDGTAKDQTPHQTDKNVEETAPSSSAANEQTNTTSTTDNDSNDDGNV